MNQLLLLTSLLLFLGCTSAAPPRAHAPRLADAEGRTCQQAARDNAPLLVEWSGAEKANLEASLNRGAIAVEYTGCELRLVAECELPGQYVWQRTSTTTDALDIKNQDQLHALLPLGAWSLESKLSQSGQLSVRTTVGGQMRLVGAKPRDVPLGGSCRRATHLLQAVSVGAFKLSAGGSLQGSGEAGIHGAGIGGQTSSSERIVRQAGDPRDCEAATADSPGAACRAPLQAFLTPLPGVTPRTRAKETVQVTFVSANADLVWEVRRNRETLCTTPCTRWVDPAETFRLRSYDGNGVPSSGGYKVDVPPLRDFTPNQAVHVEAQPRKKGRLALGIIATSIGGLAVLFGGLRSATASDTPGHENDGLSTLGVGAGLMTLGIFGIITSGPDADISGEQTAGPGAPRVGFSGRF